MANKLIAMNKIRKIIRLYSCNKGKSYIGRQTGVDRNTDKKYINKYKQLHLIAEEISEMSDQRLSEVFGKPPLIKEPS